MKPLNDAIRSIDKFFNPKKYSEESVKKMEEEKMGIEDLITSKGYPLEIHNVETEDGYILRIFRIPGGKGDTEGENKNRQPVLFQHGLLDSSDGWVCNSEDKCLPYLFASNGFDVWLSNSRGNKHSKSHKVHSATSYEFWSFSFHEMGIFDVPAVLNHIEKYNTSSVKTIYIGHSQGTCMLFSALTQKMDYFRSKIKLFIALAPVARVGGLKSPFLKTLETLKFHKMLNAANQHEVFPNNEENNIFNTWLVKNFSSVSHLIIDMISDCNSKTNNNKDQVGVYLSHYPAGASLKSISHFIQNYKSKRFSYYDYKTEANMHIYKSKTPPEYDLSTISNFPIVLLAGKEDKLASIDDVRWLKEQLGLNVVYYNEFENMGHISFLICKDIDWFKEAYEIVLKYSSVVFMNVD